MSPCRGVVIAVATVATIVVVGATALAGLVAVGSACSGAASGRTTNNDDIININDFADPSRSSCQPVPPPPHHWHRKSDCVAWAAKARCEAHRLQLDNGNSEVKTEATANNNHDDNDDDDDGQQLGCNRRDTTGHGSNNDDHPNDNYDTADCGSNDDDTDGGGGDVLVCYTTCDCWYGAPVLLQLQLQNSGWRTNRSRSGCCQIGQKTGLNRTFKLYQYVPTVLCQLYALLVGRTTSQWLSIGFHITSVQQTWSKLNSTEIGVGRRRPKRNEMEGEEKEKEREKEKKARKVQLITEREVVIARRPRWRILVFHLLYLYKYRGCFKAPLEPSDL
ncbi:hypothetical protein EDB89DRAFT_1912719 [Lactarius sanguifluus]|nr:hypothetical protein EDB89DRAFT_1912719 [Lactarius sanguifluus]